MSYETAPATIKLATHCLCCRRPLVDAVSVEIGIGPDCRKKYAFDIGVSDEARAAANKIVHDAAISTDPIEPLRAADQLAALGFAKLALKVREAFAAIRIYPHGEHNEGLRVVTPFDERFNAAIRSVPGARALYAEGAGRGGKAKYLGRYVPLSSRAALWTILCECFDGAAAVGPKGPFVVRAADPDEDGERRAS